MSIVPNKFPPRIGARRIAIIGEAPGAHEVEQGTPFVGPSGQLLNAFLSHAGIDRDACFVGNICQHRPPGNDITKFKWDGPEIQKGIFQLTADLAHYQPHLCILLGNTALRAFSGEKRTMGDWRGYVWAATHVAPGVKCIGAWHPAAILRDMSLQGEEKFFLKRAQQESMVDGLDVAVRRVHWQLNKPDIIRQLATFQEYKQPLAIDIEGGCGMGPSCVGFAPSSCDALVVPFYGVDGCSIWSEEDELELWTAVAAVLEDPLVPKIIQNAPYEMFVLAWTLGIVIQGLQDDTMLKHFELLAELDKALEFQAVLYTQQPYWKLDHRQVEGRYVPYRAGKPVTSEEWFIYNGTDCCVTFQVNQVMEARLKPQQRAHYQWQVSLLAPLAYMSLRGMKYDKAKAKERLETTQETIYELQDQINQEAATHEEGGKLREFYQAIGVQHQVDDVGGCRLAEHQQEGQTNLLGSQDPSQQPPSLAEHSQQPVVSLGDTGDTQRDARAVGQQGRHPLVPLLTSAFCQAKRTIKTEVTEVSWQPKAWNGKKWVRKGRRVKEVPNMAGGFGNEAEPEGEFNPDHLYYQAVYKVQVRNLPVEVENFEDVRRFALGSRRDACKRATAILLALRVGDKTSGACDELSQEHGTSTLTPASRGELSTLLGLEVKINSTGAGGDAQWYLYDCLHLPKQYQKEGNKLTTRLASDDEAIIKAWIQSSKDPDKRDTRALTFLKMRRLVTQTKFLCAEPDADGRIRSAMNLVAAPTCRMAMYGSPTGTSDLNMQTIGKGLRDLFVADEGCVMGQKDLSNSDAYTVAAHCALLGDSTMLDDLKAKVKPANVLARIYEAGPSINLLTREQLKEECKKVDGEGWLYFACKRVLHGSNYGMGKVTMANQILTDSFKLLGTPIWLEPKACEAIQERAFFVRYPGVRRWHDWMAREIREKGVLVASTGFQRRLFGRKDDHNTLKECLSHYPQYFTTYAIKSTLISLHDAPRQWTDPDNRREDGSLRVEPLLLVHDSNVSQWREEDTPFAREKLAAWFMNEIRVAGQALVIPASGTYGGDWKHQDASL